MITINGRDPPKFENLTKAKNKLLNSGNGYGDCGTGLFDNDVCYNRAMLARLSDTNMVTNSKLREHILLIRMQQHESAITGYIIRKNNDIYILLYVTLALLVGLLS